MNTGKRNERAAGAPEAVLKISRNIIAAATTWIFSACFCRFHHVPHEVQIDNVPPHVVASTCNYIKVCVRCLTRLKRRSNEPAIFVVRRAHAITSPQKRKLQTEGKPLRTRKSQYSYMRQHFVYICIVTPDQILQEWITIALYSVEHASLLLSHSFRRTCGEIIDFLLYDFAYSRHDFIQHHLRGREIHCWQQRRRHLTEGQDAVTHECTKIGTNIKIKFLFSLHWHAYAVENRIHKRLAYLFTYLSFPRVFRELRVVVGYKSNIWKGALNIKCSMIRNNDNHTMLSEYVKYAAQRENNVTCVLFACCAILAPYVSWRVKTKLQLPFKMP